MGIEIAQDSISALLEQSRRGVIRLAGLINDLTGIAGPVGEKSFVLVNPRTAKLINTVIKYGRSIQGVGTTVGLGFMVIGFGVGMYDDLANNDKTVGESVSHNTTSLGVGLVGSTAGTAATLGILTFLGVSNPFGWAVLGGIAIGVGLTAYFNHHYDSNTFKIQDMLDKAGKVIDNTIKSVGKAIINQGLFINPISWAW